MILYWCGIHSDKDERKKVKESIEITGRNIVEINFKQMESFAGNLLQLGEPGNKVIVISNLAFGSLTNDQKQILSSEFSVRCMIAELISKTN